MSVDYEYVEEEFDVEIPRQVASNHAVKLGGTRYWLIGYDKKGKEFYLHGGTLLIIETRTIG